MVFHLDKLAKFLGNIENYKINQELERLKKLPRYVPTKTTLLGENLEIADACTFLCGYYEIFERKIYNFVASTNQPLIIDCGANIGLSVIFFKRLYPHSKIIAFEPDPNIFSILERNLSVLGFENIEIYKKAIWIDDKNVDFQVEGGYSGRIPKPGDSENIVKIPAMRLKKLLNQKVDFLKLDIEGAETEVIRDCQDLLSNVDLIFVEYHSHIKENQSLHEILAILHKSGFRYHILEAFSVSQPFVNRQQILGMDLQLNVFAYKA